MTAPTVKVKPLVWGRYGVAMGGGAKYTCYKVRDGWDSVCYPFEGQQYSLAEGVSEQAAKAAAQADYEARILSAIDTTDLDALIGAVLAEAAEAVFSVRCAPVSREVAEWAEERADVIRALRPDALQALERAKREARVEGMREAAHIAVNACLVPPDGGSPTEEERLVCEEAYRRIMAAALIKAERGKP